MYKYIVEKIKCNQESLVKSREGREREKQF